MASIVMESGRRRVDCYGEGEGDGGKLSAVELKACKQRVGRGVLSPSVDAFTRNSRKTLFHRSCRSSPTQKTAIFVSQTMSEENFSLCLNLLKTDFVEKCNFETTRYFSFLPMHIIYLIFIITFCSFKQNFSFKITIFHIKVPFSNYCQFNQFFSHLFCRKKWEIYRNAILTEL